MTILLPVFLRATKVDFCAYMTIGFIHVAEFDFIDRFSHFATGKSLIIGEGAKAICQEIYRKLIDASFRV